MNFAVIGCGEIASTHVRALQSLADRAMVVACCDIRPERATSFAETFGLRSARYDEVLADPTINAVIVCTPSGLHADIAVPALLTGKHVVVEKPMEVSVEACERLLDAQRRSGATLGVMCQRRFDAASQRVKGALDRGVLGDLILADCRVPYFRTQAYYDSGDWRGTWQLDGGGCLINQGLHTIDLLRWMCGPVESAYAQARTAAHVGIDVEDVICATLVFENGALGTIVVTTSSYPAFPARLAFHGTSGGAVIEGDSLAAFSIIDGEHGARELPKPYAVTVASGGIRAATAAVTHAGPTGCLDSWTEGHRRQLLDFIEAVDEGRPPLVDGSEGRNTVELIELIYRSARSGEVETP